MILGVLIAVAFLLASGFLAVLWLVGKSAVTQEASNVLPDATRRLIDRTKDRLPEEARSRYEEEWPAGFDEAIEKRPIWAFREAVSLYLGARQIARELEPAPVPARRGRARVGIAANSAVANASHLATRLRDGGNRLLAGFERFERLLIERIARTVFLRFSARNHAVLRLALRVYILLLPALVAFAIGRSIFG